MKTFIIAGPIMSEEATWYNLEHGWVSNIDDASHFPRAILLEPLPPGGLFFIETSSNYEGWTVYTPLSVGGHKNTA